MNMNPVHTRMNKLEYINGRSLWDISCHANLINNNHVFSLSASSLHLELVALSLFSDRVRPLGGVFRLVPNMVAALQIFRDLGVWVDSKAPSRTDDASLGGQWWIFG